MQNGSCEGCKLQGGVGFGPQEDACGVGEFTYSFLPGGLDSG